MTTSATSLLAALKAARAKLGTNRDRPEKVPPGNSRWRILPRWDKSAGEPGHSFGLHYIKNGAGETEAVYVCTAHTFDKECPICNEIARNKAIAISAGDTALQKVLDDATSQRKILVNALRYEKDGSYAGPMVLAMPVKGYDDYLSLAVGYLEEHGIDVLDFDGGLDITIVRTGSGLGTKYQVQPVPRATAIPHNIMDSVTNLDDYVNQEYEAGLIKALNAVRALTGIAGATAAPALPASVVASEGRALDATPKVATISPRPAASSVPASVSPATVKPVVIEATAVSDELDGIEGLDLDDIDLDGIANTASRS